MKFADFFSANDLALWMTANELARAHRHIHTVTLTRKFIYKQFHPYFIAMVQSKYFNSNICDGFSKIYWPLLFDADEDWSLKLNWKIHSFFLTSKHFYLTSEFSGKKIVNYDNCVNKQKSIRKKTKQTRKVTANADVVCYLTLINLQQTQKFDL